jgi:hypothetical protein
MNTKSPPRYRVGKRDANIWPREWIIHEMEYAETFEQKAAGVPYYWELSGPDGGWFLLFKLPHHTDEDIQAAAKKLYQDQDVTGINYIEVSQ